MEYILRIPLQTFKIKRECVMNVFKKALLTGAASLTLAFGGAVAQAQATQAPAPGTAQTQTVQKNTLTFAQLQQSYSTRASQRLAALEARLNKDRPAGTPRIVFVDPDQISTQLQLRQTPVAQFTQLVEEYLTAKRVSGLSPEELNAVAQTSFTMQQGAFAPQAIRPGLSGDALAQAAAVVVPYNPNLSTQEFMKQAFTLRAPDGKSVNTLEKATVKTAITREQLADITGAKGAWRSFDTHYLPLIAPAQGFARIMALHRTETFSEVGALMQTVKDGGAPALIGEYANFKATLVALTENARTKTFDSDNLGFYGAVIATTYPALYELQARVEKMGVENFRKMTPTQLRDMAYDITEKTALTPEQATHLSGAAALGPEYFRTLAQNKVDPAAIDAAVKFLESAYELKAAIIGKTLEGPDMGEALKELFGGGGTATPQIAPWQMFDLLQAKIYSDPAVAKNPGDVKALLNARRDLIDHARELLDSHPEKAEGMSQILQGIFTSDPLFRQSPPRPQGPSKPAPRLQQD